MTNQKAPPDQERFTREDIERLYSSEAAKHGLSTACTIQDSRTRELEYAAIRRYFKDGIRVLEIGCGNGCVAEQLAAEFNIKLTATDFSPEMIDIAKSRNLGAVKGSLEFRQLDVLQLSEKSSFDLAYTERCLQNLVSWEEQRIGLNNIADSITDGGEFVMLESFYKGYENLNQAREEIGLDPIPVSWHNLYLDEDIVTDYLASLGLLYVDEDRFLSGYYFGSRVLLPALLPEGKTAHHTSRLNDYFCAMPPAGDFCPMKILHFKKNER